MRCANACVPVIKRDSPKVRSDAAVRVLEELGQHAGEAPGPFAQAVAEAVTGNVGWVYRCLGEAAGETAAWLQPELCQALLPAEGTKPKAAKKNRGKRIETLFTIAGRSGTCPNDNALYDYATYHKSRAKPPPLLPSSRYKNGLLPGENVEIGGWTRSSDAPPEGACVLGMLKSLARSDVTGDCSRKYGASVLPRSASSRKSRHASTPEETKPPVATASSVESKCFLVALEDINPSKERIAQLSQVVVQAPGGAGRRRAPRRDRHKRRAHPGVDGGATKRPKLQAE